MDDGNSLKKLQAIEYDILSVIDIICKKHNLHYFLVGGTLLGAARHEGFIPWDDDIDIGMMREDYDKFIEIAERELEYPYKVNTFKNCDDHHYYFTHVVNTQFFVKRLGSIDQRVENVWVDIYPYDGLPNNAFLCDLFYFRLQFCNFMYHVGFFEKINLARPGRPLYQKILLAMLKKTYKFIRIDGARWRYRFDELLHKHSVEKSKYIISSSGMAGKKEIFLKDDFLPYSTLTFEDKRLCVPNNYNYYLTRLYGDWMTPPENKEFHPMELLFSDK